ncbi:tetratricopeptide repeat protein [Geobacter anodireducens]
MSSKKDKHLDSAQKFLIKGQVDRAIREYEQAVTLDPKDVRVRQKYAELLVRTNRKGEALREFEVIGKFYADNGFFLKAIAVYKQIQKIDPANSAHPSPLPPSMKSRDLSAMPWPNTRQSTRSTKRAGNSVKG